MTTYSPEATSPLVLRRQVRDAVHAGQSVTVDLLSAALHVPREHVVTALESLWLAGEVAPTPGSFDEFSPAEECP